jgi:hypothetical protein
MVEAWSELVGQSEEGDDDIIEECWNDLSVRDLLEELLPKCSVRTSRAHPRLPRNAGRARPR